MLSSKTNPFALFDTDSVVIDRTTANANPLLKTRTVIYSGSCDFQSGGGTQFYNPSGSVDIADAWMGIDPDSSGNMPSVNVGDRATVTQVLTGGSSLAPVVYNIANVSVLTFPLPHVELLLKRGPVENKR